MTHSMASLQLHATPPFSTTAFAKELHGSRATHAANFAREVDLLRPAFSKTVRIAKVPLFIHNGCPWMALHSSVVEAVAAKLEGQAILAAEAVQSQELELVAGHTAFPVYWDYGATVDGKYGERHEEVSTADGGELPEGWSARSQVVTADFKITLAYRGPEVDKSKWLTTPMSLRFNLRAVQLDDWAPEPEGQVVAIKHEIC